MSPWIAMLRGALLLDTAAFAGLCRRRDAMLRGALLIVAVALLAGLPAFIINFANAVQSHAMTGAEAAQAATGFDEFISRVQPFMQNVPPEALNSMKQGMEAGVEIAREISALPTPLPRPVGSTLRAVGGWLSRPFQGGLPLTAATLATWLGYGVWVMIAARLLGGRAQLHQFFGATALFAAPHLLNVFAIVPWLGPLMGIVAFIWGLAIYVKATAVSHELGAGRAVLAVAAPALAVLLLATLALLVLAIILLVAGAAAGR